MKKSEEIKARLTAIEAEMEECSRRTYEDREDAAKVAEYHKEWDRLYDEKEDLSQALRVERNREIQLGDGVTLCFYTDRQAYTVIKRTKKTITIQRDKATLNPDFKPEFIPGGFVGTVVNQCEQSYTYERDENGCIKTAFWSEKRGEFTVQGVSVAVGRHEFYDYNF